MLMKKYTKTTYNNKSGMKSCGNKPKYSIKNEINEISSRGKNSDIEKISWGVRFSSKNFICFSKSSLKLLGGEIGIFPNILQSISYTL
jgi:hypothetical protein